MPSIKSKLINLMLRNRHLFRGKLRKEVFDFNSSIENFRKQCEDGANRFGKLPDDVTVRKQTIGVMKAEFLIPANVDSAKIIMYVHGGGYVSGSCNDHRAIVSKFAKLVGVTCLTYEYRLAPEHPFPAAIDDSVEVYQWLLNKGYKPENIVIAGESAGGGLCLAILLALKDLGIVLPTAAVAISPWTDLACTSESYKTKNKVSLAPKDSWTVFSKYYIGENKADNPLISPLYGNLKGLPPIFINSGVDDELFEDGEKFYLKARDAGVDITFRAGVGMVHCYPLMAPIFREATVAMEEIVVFIKKGLRL